MLMAMLIRLFFWVIRLLPARLAGALGAGVGRLMYYVLSKHRRIAVVNLKRIYPDQKDQWHRSKARGSFAELGRTSFELPHVFLGSREYLKSRVNVVNEHLLQQALDEGKGVFVAACHHSNWELGGLMLSLLDYPSSVIYRPMKSAALETYLKRCRERFGADFQSRWEGLRWLPKALKQNAVIAVMVDQHISHGVQVPFMGHVANTTAMPATFHVRSGSPIIGVSLMRKGNDFQFELRFHEIQVPEITGDKDVDAYHIMRHVCSSFTPIIQRRPELWMWIHRRWFIQDLDEHLAEAIYG